MLEYDNLSHTNDRLLGIYGMAKLLKSKEIEDRKNNKICTC